MPAKKIKRKRKTKRTATPVKDKGVLDKEVNLNNPIIKDNLVLNETLSI